MGSMFVQYTCLGVVAIANKSESHEDSKENSREQNILFNERILFNHCRQVRRATGDSENRSESTTGEPEGFLSCKREAIPLPRKIMKNL
jgi:hypothetical protein